MRYVISAGGQSASSVECKASATLVQLVRELHKERTLSNGGAGAAASVATGPYRNFAFLGWNLVNLKRILLCPILNKIRLKISHYVAAALVVTSSR